MSIRVVQTDAFNTIHNIADSKPRYYVYLGGSCCAGPYETEQEAWTWAKENTLLGWF